MHCHGAVCMKMDNTEHGIYHTGQAWHRFIPLYINWSTSFPEQQIHIIQASSLFIIKSKLHVYDANVQLIKSDSAIRSCRQSLLFFEMLFMVAVSKRKYCDWSRLFIYLLASLLYFIFIKSPKIRPLQVISLAHRLILWLTALIELIKLFRAWLSDLCPFLLCPQRPRHSRVFKLHEKPTHSVFYFSVTLKMY